MSEYEAELAAISWIIRTDYSTPVCPATDKQVSGIIRLISQGISDTSRAARIRVLQRLVGPEIKRLKGVELQSTRDLTSPIASYLINQLKDPRSTEWRLSPHGQWLIHEAECCHD